MCAAPAPAADGASKQKVLIDALAAELRPQSDKIIEMLAKLTVTVQALNAKVDTLATAGGKAAAPAAKRTVAAKAPAAGAKAAPKAGAKAAKPAKAANTDPNAKVSNALLYMRHVMKYDMPCGDSTYREVYAAELEEVADNEKLAAKNAETDPEGYYSVAGNLVWSMLSDDQKDTVRAEYAAWKDGNAADNDEPPLEDDDA